jgi:hypothetical protein
MAGITMEGFASSPSAPTDPQDHPADSGHNDNHATGRAASPVGNSGVNPKGITAGSVIAGSVGATSFGGAPLSYGGR